MPTTVENIQNSLTKRTLNYFFLLILLTFITIGIIDKDYYVHLLREDSLANWITFWMLVIASFISFITAKTKSNQRIKLFFILFGLFSLLGALEEISWGQRVFDIKSTAFFNEYSDQNEINLHNVAQKVFKIKTKHLAAVALLFFGFIIPYCFEKGKLNFIKFLDKWVVFPKQHLYFGFILGTIFMIDLPSKSEEEIGEMVYSICFVLFTFYNYGDDK
ncbi:MAG: hypothetical protein AB8B61_07285 [Cyclobacteriaceae bacterium]